MNKRHMPSGLARALKEARQNVISTLNVLRQGQKDKNVDFQVKPSQEASEM